MLNYINWREEPALPGQKPRKVPFDPTTGERIDPHDPAAWRTYDQVSKSEHIGVVLTDGDPYFLLDIDDCLQPDGTWHPHAVDLCGRFPNAAVEISISRKGLHIMGQCHPLPHLKNRFMHGDVNCEFYHTKRFVALGQGFTGNMEIDWTATLDAVIPHRPAIQQIQLTEGPVPEYGGTQDDDELIQVMLRATGGANVIFGNGASFADLWNRNVEVLARAYPTSTPGEEFDGSAADIAMFNHLAFYTGKDAARMDRLFRRSALVRPKYTDRVDYQQWTISNAIGITKKVYKERQPALNHDGSVNQFGEMMTVQDQMTYFAGCFYVVDEHRVMIPGGDVLKPPQFKALYGGYTFQMAMDMTKPTTNAFEAFTENRAFKFPKVRRVRFLPQMEHGAIVGDGVNCYFPEQIESVAGDITPFMDLLAKLLPLETDRIILLSWMASLVQNPGRKFLWSPVVQGVQGNGKSSLGEILFYCIGERYSWSIKPDKIDGKFNAFTSRRIFINVEEMNLFNKHELMESLKDYITGTRQEVERKGVDSGMDPDYCANWFFTTNHKDAIVKVKDDRRYAIFFTAQQSREDMARDGMLDPDYFPNFWQWLRTGGGFQAMHHFLSTWQIPTEFDPAGKAFMAPITSTTTEAVAISYGVVEQYIMDAVEAEVVGFKGGWLSTWAVQKMLAEHNLRRAPRKLAAILEGLGYERWGRAPQPIMQENNQRPTLWKVKGADVLEYDVAQNYARASLPSS